MEDERMSEMAPEEEKIKGEKFTAGLAYLSWFTVIPMVYASESKLVKYHANQGLVLAIFETIFLIITAIVSRILWSYSLSMSLLVETTMLMVFVGVFGSLSLIGIFNVIRGKEKPVPTFGHIRILK